MADLATAIQVALAAHAGQQDKAGQPYILHPLRLMLRMSTPEEMIVAVLHDVVEDSQITRADLECMGFAEPILDALDAIALARSAGREPAALHNPPKTSTALVPLHI